MRLLLDVGDARRHNLLGWRFHFRHLRNLWFRLLWLFLHLRDFIRLLLQLDLGHQLLPGQFHLFELLEPLGTLLQMSKSAQPFRRNFFLGFRINDIGRTGWPLLLSNSRLDRLCRTIFQLDVDWSFSCWGSSWFLFHRCRFL
uniref:(northern house mosquito) hypothetical protein n=1 Tax=Culex pipiens TaxID=7175 RepID=A0A8D8MM99_CULPI